MGTPRNHAQGTQDNTGTPDNTGSMRRMGEVAGDVMTGLRSGRQLTTRKPNHSPSDDKRNASRDVSKPAVQRSTQLAVQPATPATSAAPVCQSCGGFGVVREWVGPEPWRTRVVDCDCHGGEVAHARWERALRASDISPRLLALDFAGYDTTYNRAALDAVASWARDLACARAGNATPLPWLLLYGGFGTGKTHLLAAAFNVLLGDKRYPLYTLVPALLDHVKDGLDSDKPGEYGARFKAVREAPILLLDDLGAEKRTEWSDELLFKLLDYRYREELPTAVASNLIPADLESRIASRLQDRALSSVVLMAGPDYRVSGPAKGKSR